MPLYKKIQPNSFDAPKHWYAKALNATIHPTVSFFFSLDTDRIVNRYCHLHPIVDRDFLIKILSYEPEYFFWSGADLLNVTSAGGKRQMVLIETNSCPSGQKSMPLRDDFQEMGGYKTLIEQTFLPQMRKKAPKEGVLAVLFDKNNVESAGYAASLAELLNETVYLIEFTHTDPDPPVRVQDEWIEIKDENGDWLRVRAVYRYVTQKPWSRIPLHCKTFIFNPIVACLAGGRNKMIAAKAYDFLNAEIEKSGLSISIPETIWNVSKEEVPLYVNKMGGQAVIKVPYSNAGQGVYTIVNQRELDNFMSLSFDYEQFIVQSLIGNYQWTSKTSKGKLYHVGTVPDKKGNSYVADIRMMLHATEQGLKPISIYARKAANPLVGQLESSDNSWDILGTNLSIKLPNGTWDSDTNRLILMDRRDFNKLGIGLDDMLEGYLQTVLATIAIDKMAQKLMNSEGRFRMDLFDSLNHDTALLREIML